MRSREIWIAGYPGFYGGADTELDHNIDLWRARNVEVHLVPLVKPDDGMKQLCDKRGCITHRYETGIFNNRVVASFCNGGFLQKLPEIIEAGRPQCVIWFNCMTWTFPEEITAHANGWIDLHGFVSDYQRKMLKPALEKHRAVRELHGYKPFYDINNASQPLAFRYHPPEQYFAVGRVSRDDASKFAEDTWSIFQKVCAPIPKKVFILGYGENAHAKCGPPPDGLDWQTWSPNAVPVRNIFGKLHALIHKTGGSRESYGRIIPEAYAAGVPVIVENDFAFPELVIDGITGYLCRSSDEMSFRASELAFDESRRRRIIESAREHLLNHIASSDSCWKAWEAVV
jgi:glycosyltransferase involved in cell wall biosynthesis